MDIYRNGSVIIRVHPSDSDKVTKKVMGENTLSLTFNLSEYFAFKVGDFCYFQGEKYTLNVVPKEKKNSTFQFEYDLVFEGIEYELRKIQHLYYTANLEYTGGSDFSLMGDAELHARVIIENLNRVQSGWTLGEVEETSVKNITFSSNNCLEAITKIAQEFDTEYWVGSDKTINIGKRGDLLPVSFEYGKGKGLYSIERTPVNSKDIITRLYPFGSSQNLIKGYRNNSKRLKISTDYIERNVSTYGIIESSEIFEDIKPERTGTITGVGDIYTFSDSSMDFDLKAESGGNTLYLIPGTSAKIHFQTGDLAGYEFEISDYNHSTKAFIINKFTNEIAYDLPNNTLKPRVGDKYIILDIYMPQSYVDAAEARLLAKAQESLNQNSEPNVAYKVDVDPLFIKNLNVTIKAGDYAPVVDSQLDVDRNIRIVKLTRSINKPDKYDFELADTVEPSIESRIETTLQNQDIILKINKLNDPARARRNYKVVQELQNAIFDNEGYFEPTNIKPLSIETSMLSVGSKWNNFYLDGLFEPNYVGGVNNFKYSGGTLAHNAIDGVNTWVITSIQETIADNNLRYIYAICDKDANTGYIVISTDKLSVDGGSNWQFLVGVLSSVFDGARMFTPTYGNTTVNGRFIKTGRISSTDGLTYFDLDDGEIQGDIRFKGDVSSRVFQVGPVDNPKAGMTGTGEEDTDVRFYAGAGYAARNNAPFRVLQNGKVIALTGELAGWEIDSDNLKKEDGLYKVELNSVNRSLKFSYDGIDKVSIFGEDIPTLSTLISPSTGTVYPGANTSNTIAAEFVDESHSYLAPTSITLINSSIKLRTKINFQGVGVQLTIKAYLADVNGNKVKLIGSLQRYLTNFLGNSTVPYYWEVYSTVNAGTYKILYEYTLNGEEGDVFYLGGSTPSTDSYVYYSQQKTGALMGKNGLACFFSSSKYIDISDNEDIFLQIRGAQKQISSNGNQSIEVLNSAIKPSRLNLQGMVLNLATKSSNYTISSSDKLLAGIKIIGDSSDVTITLPDLDAYETIDGTNFYYNDNRPILILNSDRWAYVAPDTGEKVRNSTSAYEINRTHTGFIFIGDRANHNWMILGLG